MSEPVGKALDIDTAPESTDVHALRREIQYLSPQRQYDAIISSHDVIRVVRAMPAQDLYAITRARGIADSLELLEHMHARQVQTVLDLDGWRRDRLDPTAMGEWLEALFAANPRRAVQQVRALDVELTSLLLKLHTRVFDLEQEEQPPDDLLGVHTITPDRKYLVCFLGDPQTMPLIGALKNTVEGLFERDAQWVLRMLEAVRWEMPSQLEEEALRWRDARMQDLGFAPVGEAGEIFGYIDPDSSHAKAAPLAPSKSAAPDGDAEPVVDLSTSVLLPEGFADNAVFREAFAGLDSAAQSRVAHELVMCANRVHGADAGDPGDMDAIAETARSVLHTVAMAIAYIAERDGLDKHLPLARIAVARLFQVGYSLALRVGRRLRTLLADKDAGLAGNGILRLDHPLREVVAGVLKKRPVFFEGLIAPKSVVFRRFASLSEVAAATAAVTEAAFRARLMHGALGVTDAVLSAHGLDADDPQPSHAVLLSTALVRHMAGTLNTADVPAAFAPLTDAEITALFTSAPVADGVRRLPADAKAAAIAWAGDKSAAAAPLPGAVDQDAARARGANYARVALGALEAEMGRVLDETPDARFLSAVWSAAARDQAKDALASAD